MIKTQSFFGNITGTQDIYFTHFESIGISGEYFGDLRHRDAPKEAKEMP